MTPSAANDREQLLENFKNDFNHIADHRILVEPEELADYMLVYKAQAERKARIDELKGLSRYKGQDADEEVNKILAERISKLERKSDESK